MKYIKLFESFEGYEEVPNMAIILIEHENFTEKEIKCIKDIANCNLKYSRFVSRTSLMQADKDNTSVIDLTGTSVKSIRIIKQKDEWYFLFTFNEKRSHYYKCDQFDGLIKCLKDNL